VIRRTGLLVGLAAVMVAIAACGSGGSNDDATGGAGSTPASAAVTETATGAVVPELLDFRAPLVGGGELDSATFAGTPVVYWFWAPT